MGLLFPPFPINENNLRLSQSLSGWVILKVCQLDQMRAHISDRLNTYRDLKLGLRKSGEVEEPGGKKNWEQNCPCFFFCPSPHPTSESVQAIHHRCFPLLLLDLLKPNRTFGSSADVRGGRRHTACFACCQGPSLTTTAQSELFRMWVTTPLVPQKMQHC